MYRVAIRKFADLARYFGAVVLFFVVLISQGSSFAASPSSDLVFCPIQREWVRKSEERERAGRVLLADICAPLELKAGFSRRLFVKSVAPIDAEDLFFDFVAMGDQAFLAIPCGPASDGSGKATLSRNTGSVVAGQFHTNTLVPNGAATKSDVDSFSQAVIYNSCNTLAPYLESTSDGVTQRGPPELL
ncbi:MAG: hypothetical protein ABI878_05995 [Acidobacteriota bacterium]